MTHRGSRRRRSPLRRIRHRVRPWIARPLARAATAVLPPLYLAYLRLVFATSRVDDSQLKDVPELLKTHDGAVALLWHEEVFVVPYAFGVAAGLRVHTLASAGDAGEVVTRILERCGFEVFRGGSSRHRSRRRPGVLLAMIRHMREGRRVLYGITVDGSKGPAYRMKPGGVTIAARCGRPVLLSRVWFARCWRLPTWDRTAIPLPFNRIVFYLRGPFAPPADPRDAEAVEQFRRDMEGRLLTLAAESYDDMDQPRPPALQAPT